MDQFRKPGIKEDRNKPTEGDQKRNLKSLWEQKRHEAEKYKYKYKKYK